MLASTLNSSARFCAAVLNERLADESRGPHAFQGAPYSIGAGCPTRPTTQIEKSTSDGTAAASAGPRAARKAATRSRIESLRDASSGLRVVSKSQGNANPRNAKT